MTLSNILDYVEDGQGFHIPEYEHSNRFPFFIGDEAMIVDKDGAPAIFFADMLDSMRWDTYERLPSGSDKVSE
jgi:hypothetical protein